MMNRTFSIGFASDDCANPKSEYHFPYSAQATVVFFSFLQLCSCRNGK